jgi:hypothetical protein
MSFERLNGVALAALLALHAPHPAAVTGDRRGLVRVLLSSTSRVFPDRVARP